jgi:tRNA (guanine-N7-)-methyltransferase
MCERAQAFPDSMMIGIEGQESVIVRAAEKVRTNGLWNAYLISGYVRDIHEFFEDGELDGIFLNFSDPWPKARHARRRLTCRENLAAYMDVIRKGGFIEFKTDNADLFDFTLEEIKALGYEIDEMSEDLHECDGLGDCDGLDDCDDLGDCDGLGDDEETAFDGAGASARFRTEYEEKFMKKGVKIKFVRLIK